MPGQVIASGFTQTGLLALNGSHSIAATRRDVLRLMLCVGYPGRKSATATAGRWRAKMLTAMVRGDLDDSLATTLYFRNLEQSEKVGVSFLLGEAFAHWFAQHHMQVPILVPVTGLPGCQWASASTTLALKNGAQLPAEKSRPDFIGIRRHERHVFESKGRIRHPSTQTIAKALGQVSKIATVNGAIPTTRCVTAFMFKASGSSGMVVDPPAHPASHLGTRICLRVSHNLPSDNPVQLRAVWSKTIPKTNHMAADSSLSHCHTKGFN